MVQPWAGSNYLRSPLALVGATARRILCVVTLRSIVDSGKCHLIADPWARTHLSWL